MLARLIGPVAANSLSIPNVRSTAGTLYPSSDHLLDVSVTSSVSCRCRLVTRVDGSDLQLTPGKAMGNQPAQDLRGPVGDLHCANGLPSLGQIHLGGDAHATVHLYRSIDHSGGHLCRENL